MIRLAAFAAIILMAMLPASAQFYPRPAGSEPEAPSDAAPFPPASTPNELGSGPATGADGTGSGDRSATAPEEAPAVTPVVSAELSSDAVLVGQPVVLRIKVLVPTWLPEPPVFPALDLPDVILRLPERASGPISERVGGETWSGVSRAYRLYPMVPGTVSLPAGEVTVTFADPDTTRPVTYTAPLDPMRFEATVPEAAEGLDPLVVAEGFTLEQEVEAPKAALGQGDAASRRVTARITGTSPLFIPELIPPPVDGEGALRTYPRDPRTEESEERGVLSGSRTEEVSYVAQHGGEVDLPAIAIDWFNISTGEVETARLDGTTLVIDAPAAPSELPVTPRQVVVLLVVLAIILVAARLVWKAVEPRLSAWRDRKRAEREASESRAAEMVQRAIDNRDLSASHAALAIWQQRCPGPEASELEAALAGIGAASYRTPGGEAGGWPELSAAFRRERDRRLDTLRHARSALPPLNP